jgi:hypothetical protein
MPFCPVAIGMSSRSAFRIDWAKTEIYVTDIPAGRTERMSDPRPARKEGHADPGCSCHNPEGELSGDQFFYFFPCNPLKSPDSTKEIQGNARIFPCFYLDLLAGNSPFGCGPWGRPSGVWAGPNPPARSTAPSRRPGPSPSRSARPRSAASAPCPGRRGETRRRACRPSRNPARPRRG